MSTAGIVAVSGRASPTRRPAKQGCFFQGRDAVRVRISDSIVADAAAGHNCIKVRGACRLTPRDVRLPRNLVPGH